MGIWPVARSFFRRSKMLLMLAEKLWAAFGKAIRLVKKKVAKLIFMLFGHAKKLFFA
tara:strand:- start:13433 stop:13603 length:171 start_codon:yes stop_codon:yes gene_type:complete